MVKARFLACSNICVHATSCSRGEALFYKIWYSTFELWHFESEIPRDLILSGYNNFKACIFIFMLNNTILGCKQAGHSLVFGRFATACEEFEMAFCFLWNFNKWAVMQPIHKTHFRLLPCWKCTHENAFSKRTQALVMSSAQFHKNIVRAFNSWKKSILDLSAGYQIDMFFMEPVARNTSPKVSTSAL